MTTPADELHEAIFKSRGTPYFICCSGCQYLAIGDYGNVVAHALDQIHGMAGDDDGSARLHEAVQDISDVGARYWINGFKRFIEHEQLRGVNQSTGESYLLGHAGGVIDDESSAHGIEVEQLEKISGAFGNDGTVHPAQEARVGYELKACQAVKEPNTVAQHADAPLCLDEIAPHIKTVHGNGAGIGPQQPSGHRERRGLTGTVGTNEAEKRSTGNREVDSIDGEFLTKTLGKSADFKRRNESGVFGHGTTLKPIRPQRGVCRRICGDNQLLESIGRGSSLTPRALRKVVMTITAAADGSALGNPGPAGWAWYVDDNTWAAGGWDHATNNQGELMAVLQLFRATAHVDDDLLILCDSQYVINSITKWMPGWKKKGWRKGDGKPVMNVDLIKQIDDAIAGRRYRFEWVRGHVGHPLNEAADVRARGAAEAFQRRSVCPAGPGYPGATASDASLPGATDEIAPLF